MKLSKYKKDFPFFAAQEKPVYYLDSAATSQKPQVVVDSLTKFYTRMNSNVHRGVYGLSERATDAYEGARSYIASYMKAKHTREVIFTAGLTDAINLLAHSFSEASVLGLRAGDEILLSISEHHSNIVPWQMLATKLSLKIKYIPLAEDNRLDLEQAKKLVTERTKLISVAHVSNVTGYIHPIKAIAKMAKQCGAIFFVDGAQGASHLKIDVEDLGCDAYGISAHKALGPTGTGALYVKDSLLQKLAPYRTGGSMIQRVFADHSTWAQVPNKFEAGTPHIAGVLGMQAAFEYLAACDLEAHRSRELGLARDLVDELKKDQDISLYNSLDADDSVAIVSFYHKKIHPHDMAQMCDSFGVCIRAGHHCAQPLMESWQVPATSRVSFYLYNDSQDLEKFLLAYHKAKKTFC
jgi:cysteine desulfurase / selenocysteine lyase